MQRIVTFDRRAWGLLRKFTKKSADPYEFYTLVYIFILRRAGMTHAESRFFKDLGKEINPRAFSVSEEFDSKLTILRKRTCKGTNWGTNWGSNSLMSTMSAMVVGEVKPADDEILIQDDYYI